MTAKYRRQGVGYVLLVGTALVLFWRGAWGLMDMYLFPDHEFTSYSVSILLGLLVLIVTHKIKEIL